MELSCGHICGKFHRSVSASVDPISDTRTSFFGLPMWVEDPDNSVSDIGICSVRLPRWTENQQLSRNLLGFLRQTEIAEAHGPID